ncbi:hypothetical protein D1AOALGA4SA_72 [Olavius algarvensis Delta 1 endosymbiont]|nr:hypothetical protein D1AOALGA4SA_72 [Olavius algarvensis Delta 1 endosymbiont]
MKNNLSMLPNQNLIYFLLCGAGVIAFIFLIIIPNQNASADLDQDITMLNSHIEQQQILRPVFDSLLERAKRKNPSTLPATKLEKLDRGDINKISGVLQETAGRYDLKIVDFRTDANEIVNNSGYLLIKVHATGDLMNFRRFLFELGAFPALEQIEEINIRAIEGSREFNLTIRMAQQS